MNKMGNKRKLSSSSESSSGSSYTHGGATKKAKNTTATQRFVSTSKHGRVVIEGLCVTKKTGQVFYPQDSIFVFRENDDDIDNIKSVISNNEKKWIECGHAVSLFSQTFDGTLPTVVGGFTRGFTRSIFK
jgi:translation elongation factor P/translation initiation factor 5A